MPCFECKITTLLWKPMLADEELSGRLPYNVYIAYVRLQASDIPVAIAHPTIEDPYPAGTLARLMGTAHFVGNTMIVVAKFMHPVAFAPAPGLPSPDHDMLPHFSLTGNVSSEVSPYSHNPACVSFEVVIERDDVFPSTPLVVICVLNRDANRMALDEYPAHGTPVIVAGPLCGWASSGKVIIDVHVLETAYRWPACPYPITESPSPFPRARFRGGLPRFPRYGPARLTRDVVSNSAAPTYVAPVPTAPEDPRLRRSAAGVAPGDAPVGAHVEAMEVDDAADGAAFVSGWMPGDGGPTVTPPRRDDADRVVVDASVGDATVPVETVPVPSTTGMDRVDGYASSSSSDAVDPALQRMASLEPSNAHDGDATASVQDIRDAFNRRSSTRSSSAGMIEAANVPILLTYYALPDDAIPPSTFIWVTGRFTFKFPNVVVVIDSFDRCEAPFPPRFFVPLVRFEGSVSSKITVERAGASWKIQFLCAINGPTFMKAWCQIERSRLESANIPSLYEKAAVRIIGEVAGYHRSFVEIRCVSLSCLLYPRDIIDDEPIYTPRSGAPNLAMMGIFLPSYIRLNGARASTENTSDDQWVTSVADGFVSRPYGAWDPDVRRLGGAQPVANSPAPSVVTASPIPSFDLPGVFDASSRVPSRIYPRVGAPAFPPDAAAALRLAAPSTPFPSGNGAAVLPFLPLAPESATSGIAMTTPINPLSIQLPIPGSPLVPAPDLDFSAFDLSHLDWASFMASTFIPASSASDFVFPELSPSQSVAVPSTGHVIPRDPPIASSSTRTIAGGPVHGDVAMADTSAHDTTSEAGELFSGPADDSVSTVTPIDGAVPVDELGDLAATQGDLPDDFLAWAAANGHFAIDGAGDVSDVDIDECVLQLPI
ncbi:hypothetical protein AURDEDRAFT_174571 [Auricularia subglabra TFB-10046 SS5]|uniref:Uncharacterized protein n=1 Tax=Auricularia subglabra (strain TFB-10046 / SS5) TaxID=717982 RepID=J0D9B6_AURST|nr:hypothetical protein AURDEDRAFT_174571 [Auricularia subglabra TFB-10046 SS5]